MKSKTITEDTIAKEINSNEASFPCAVIKIPNLCTDNSSKVIDSSCPIQFINCTIAHFNVIKE